MKNTTVSPLVPNDVKTKNNKFLIDRLTKQKTMSAPPLNLESLVDANFEPGVRNQVLYQLSELNRVAVEMRTAGLSSQIEQDLFALGVCDAFQGLDEVKAFLGCLKEGCSSQFDDLRAELGNRLWHFGAVKDQSYADGLGLLGYFARFLWNLEVLFR